MFDAIPAKCHYQQKAGSSDRRKGSVGFQRLHSENRISFKKPPDTKFDDLTCSKAEEENRMVELSLHLYIAADEIVLAA